MPLNINDPDADLHRALTSAIETAIPGAQAQAAGGGGHFTLRVVSKEFEGKNTLAKQRMVLRAIAHLMKGDNAPVHAIDKLETVVPDAT